MPEWTITETGTAPVGMTTEQELYAERQMNELLRESYADLESLYREDVGWQKIGAESSRFTTDGRKRIAALADLSATGNALIKRGVNLRIAYVWGQGVTVSIRDDGSEGQDINAVWQQFWDEPSNRREFTSSEAQARYERKLATGGEAFWAFPTSRLTGRVRVRRIPASEIKDRICDPDDEATVWLYKRVWNAVTVNKKTGERGTEQRTTYYPALGFYPAARPETYIGNPIRWDAPMRPVTVNCPDEDWRGLGDVLAAMPWAKMDKEFLEDLAVYMRALTRILGQVTSRTGRAAKAAADALRTANTAAAATAATPGVPGGYGAGAWVATDASTSLQMVSKSGAQIDANSSKPFASRAAAALEVPLTMLLGDPGITGARATAETLDQPTELMAKLRRQVHGELFRDIANYVIDMAVIAPGGPLRGSVVKDGDRLVVTLLEGDDRSVQIDWPEFNSTPLKDLVAAIAAADATEKLPPLEVFKLLAKAFGIDDIDELIGDLTDDEGNWLDPEARAAQAAVEAHRRGDDPARVL